MRVKVDLSIGRIHPEAACGIPDSVMADFHDFDYESPTALPARVLLTFKFCPWCGADRRNVSNEDRKIVEVIRPA
jgi:hypothetical protein